ncbi:MAG: GEVED domain-containing protein [Planctomycetota bacterium]
MKRVKRDAILACTMALLFGSVHVAADVIVVPWPVGPPNDSCNRAPIVGDVKDLAFDTTRATFDGPGHCTTSPNIWYQYVPPGTGEVTVSLAGSLFDTKLAVYDGPQCNPRLSDLIECNDDFGDSLTSQVTFQATAGSAYLIEVGGFNSTDVGRGLLNIVSDATIPPPKDDCANAIAIGDVTDLPFDTTNATFDGPGRCMVSPNIWYCYTASCTGDVTVSLMGSSFDTMLAVYDRCNCPPAIHDLIECNDDTNGSFQSEITFAAIAGEQYLIEVGGFGSDKGPGVLNVKCQGDPGPPPSKDNCANARPVGDVVNLPFDTTNATFDGPGLCMRSPNTWFCYTATCNGEATVSLLGSAFDTMLAAYKGCDCNLTSQDLIACNDDFGSVLQSKISFDVVAGNQYLIEVGGFATETGQGVLSISCEPAATPDKPDLGDAPDSTNNFGNSMTAYPKGVFTGPRGHFPTVFDDGSGVGPHGPAHLNSQVVAYLGRQITRETEADTGPDEDGINNIRPQSNWPDEDGGDDGVVLPLNLPNCGWATIDYNITVVAPGTDLWVNVWLDFNRDGDWDDTLTCPRGPAPEWAVQNQFLFDLPAGLNQITTPAFLSSHPKNTPEDIWMRITLSEKPWTGGSNPGELGNAGSGPRTKYEIGETEDYYFAPETADDGDCPLCEDVNGDGVIDISDLAAFVSKWLANCP